MPLHQPVWGVGDDACQKDDTGEAELQKNLLHRRSTSILRPPSAVGNPFNFVYLILSWDSDGLEVFVEPLLPRAKARGESGPFSSPSVASCYLALFNPPKYSIYASSVLIFDIVLLVEV